jgi:hypothetical protein
LRANIANKKTVYLGEVSRKVDYIKRGSMQTPSKIIKNSFKKTFWYNNK